MDAIVHYREKRSHVAIWIQYGRQHRQKLNVCSPAPTPVQPRIRFRSAAFCFRFPKRFRLALFRMPFRSMPFFARGGLRSPEGLRVQSSGGREGGREVGRSVPTGCFWWRLWYRNPSHPHPFPPSPFPLQHSARLEETLYLSGVLFVPGEEGQVRFELAVVV